MRYYPKNAVGIEFNEENCEALSEAIKELHETWDNDYWDEELFNEIDDEFGVIPMRVGPLTEERGGEITGLTGFDDGQPYLFFDLKEQDKHNWERFVAFLNQNNITIYEGSWSQLG